MNDEIKEIELDHFNSIKELKQNVETWIKEEEMYWERWFSLYDLKTLLDYITNLQQENETLHENNRNMQEEMARTWKKCDDYKSRCEKAINFIEEMLYPIGSCVNGSDLPYESIESLLNILQNGSDS